jgi:hypothetical protein
MENKTHFDFIASIVLVLLGIYVIIAGYGIVIDAKEPFQVSPGLFPVMLGYILVFCSLLLFLDSTRGRGLKLTVEEARDWWKETTRSRNIRVTLTGILIMFVYTFILLPLLPFWLSSLVFMAVLMFFLHAAAPFKIILISACTVAAVVVFFEVCFGVPLP